MTALPPRPTHNFNPLRFCPPTIVPEDELRQMIATAAYLRAAGRGFAPGHENEDWLAAKAEVEQELERQTFVYF